MKKNIILIYIITAFLLSCKKKAFIVDFDSTSPSEYALLFLQKEKIPGMSISVSKKGKLIWSKGFGFSNIKTKSKVYPNSTQFRIASISKSISAVVLALVVDKGKLELDYSIYKYLPNYPKKKYDFTIRQLGGHVSGIRHYKNKEFLLNKKISITESLDIFKKDPLLFKPQTQYKYSTYGWILLSEIIQTTTRTPFKKYVKKNILTPLKMFSTEIDSPDFLKPNKTHFYTKSKANNIVKAPNVNNEFKVAGGGFISTSEDLLKFGNEIISPKLISKNIRNELVKPQILKSGKSTQYGIGFKIEKTKNNTIKYSHSGEGIGASSLIVIYPKEEIVISILTNLSKVPTHKIGRQLESVFVN